jgi:hypothetical protein
MALTSVTLKSKDVYSDMVRITVTVVDDAVGTHDFTFDLAGESATTVVLKGLILRRLAALAAKQALPAVGTTVTIPSDPGPDAAALARQAWLEKWRRLKSANALVASGVVSAAEAQAQITALKTSLHDDFIALPGAAQAAYLDAMGGA